MLVACRAQVFHLCPCKPPACGAAIAQSCGNASARRRQRRTTRTVSGRTQRSQPDSRLGVSLSAFSCIPVSGELLGAKITMAADELDTGKGPHMPACDTGLAAMLHLALDDHISTGPCVSTSSLMMLFQSSLCCFALS